MSISGFFRVGTLGTDALACSCIRAPPLMKRARPTWLMAQVGRVEPLRSDGGGDTLGRVPSIPGPCTTSSCVERSIPEPARSAERHSGRDMLSVVLPAHSRPAHAPRGVDRPLPARAHRADRRAPARGEPLFAGVPWGFGVEMGVCGHVIVSTSRCVPSCNGSPETRNRAADDRLTSSSRQGGSTRTRVA